MNATDQAFREAVIEMFEAFDARLKRLEQAAAGEPVDELHEKWVAAKARFASRER